MGFIWNIRESEHLGSNVKGFFKKSTKMKSVLVLALFVCFFFVTLAAKTVDQTGILNAEAEGEMVRGSVLDGVLIGREARDLDKQKNKNKDKKSKLKSKDKPDKVKKKNGKTSKGTLNKKGRKGNNKKEK